MFAHRTIVAPYRLVRTTFCAPLRCVIVIVIRFAFVLCLCLGLCWFLVLVCVGLLSVSVLSASVCLCVSRSMNTVSHSVDCPLMLLLMIMMTRALNQTPGPRNESLTCTNKNYNSSSLLCSQNILTVRSGFAIFSFFCTADWSPLRMPLPPGSWQKVI